MSDQWFYSQDGSDLFGPTTMEELIQKAQAGEIQPSTLVWNDAMDERLPADKVQRLNMYVNQPEAPSPPSNGTNQAKDATPSATTPPGVTPTETPAVTDKDVQDLISSMDEPSPSGPIPQASGEAQAVEALAVTRQLFRSLENIQVWVTMLLIGSGIGGLAGIVGITMALLRLGTNPPAGFTPLVLVLACVFGLVVCVIWPVTCLRYWLTLNRFKRYQTQWALERLFDDAQRVWRTATLLLTFAVFMLGLVTLDSTQYRQPPAKVEPATDGTGKVPIKIKGPASVGGKSSKETKSSKNN